MRAPDPAPHGHGRLMPRLLNLIAAESVAIDQLTGRVTAFNMLDAMLVAVAPTPTTPTAFMRLTIVSNYDLSDENEVIQERMRIIAPDSSVVVASETPVVLQARGEEGLPTTHTSIHVFWNVLLTQTGDYRLVADYRRPPNDDWLMLQERRIVVAATVHRILNAPSVGAARGSVSGDAPDQSSSGLP